MAQSIAGTHLADNWAASSQRPVYKVEIQWDGVSWTDESDYVKSFRLQIGLALNGINGLPMMGAGSPSYASLVLDNTTHRFSPRNTESPLHPYIQYQFMNIPVRIETGYWDSAGGAELLRSFTGFLLTGQETESSGAAPSIVFDLRGGEQAILQFKQSTLLYRGVTLDVLAEDLLSAANVTMQYWDKCLLPIPYLWLDDENTWEQLQQLAQTEMCWLWFNETGSCNLLRFSSIVERTNSTITQLTLDSGNAFYMESSPFSMNAYTKVTVEIAARGEGGAEAVYISPEAIEVPPNGSKKITAQFRSGLWRIINPVKNADWFAASAGGQDMSGNITIDYEALCQRGDFTFYNSHAHLPAFIFGLQIRGYPLVGEECQDFSVEAKPEDLSNYWRGTNAALKELPLRGNVYLQTEQQAQLLAAMARDWMSKPRTMIKWEGVPAPWLQPLDRVHISNDSTGIDEDGWILNSSLQFSNGKFRQSLVILPCAELLPHDGYFIIGTSAYKDSNSGKAFY